MLFLGLGFGGWVSTPLLHGGMDIHGDEERLSIEKNGEEMSRFL